MKRRRCNTRIKRQKGSKTLKKAKAKINTKKYKGGLRESKSAFKTLKCSPASNPAFKDTCYSHSNMTKLKQLWNEKYPDKAIHATNSEAIWSSLKHNMSSLCDKESCWLKQLAKEVGVKQELIDSFAPKSPDDWKTDPNVWLSNIDILKVMKQYEEKYHCFEFYGPSPIDWNTKKGSESCVTEDLCKFQLEKEIKRGKTKIGIIFNLDPHYKGGSHWVSLFINVKKRQIFFFDSAGATCPKKIREFVDKVKEQGKKLSPSIDFKFDQNHPTTHQYTTTECGVYSLYFIVHMLKDKLSAQYLKTHKIGDKYIEGYRKIFFNPEL